jgi:hypothetical protein
MEKHLSVWRDAFFVLHYRRAVAPLKESLEEGRKV